MGRHRLPAPQRDGRGMRGGTAVRTGLLGACVAVVLGTAAVTTGLVPVGGSFPYVGSGADTGAKAEAKGPATGDGTGDTSGQRGLANLSGRSPDAPSPSGGPSGSTSPSPSPSASASASPSPSASASASASPAPAPSTKAPQVPVPAPPKPPKPADPPPAKPSVPASGGGSSEEAAVLTLVNVERAKAGCGPVRANPPLASLASAFSKDMAVRGFFDHTDPDGRTPWDRASNAGITSLGGENIARGQGDADSVMKAWMDSPGHRANILNCEYRTLGVGAYFASGGPWWTQDFGF
ncbi:CAP domain-containing protein [Streptomyces sp. NBC_00536]|uniref:CAP domain-containing protein n=1 Tax=Streptomyces sp. NBC_00536 TaxID=2975769 RepID=UPI002E811499|nr:CAP domain-containing protein [Streptomyces sp. NBC_00536]WUC81518.1 CAP domain-containing protein [Streptomyces sp. NBC_00536]